MEGLRTSHANLVVYIHPSKANKVSQAILRELSSLLFKYNEMFDGVVLAYDVGVRNETARILPGVHPFYGVKLTAELLLFSPKPGMLVEGKVVRIGEDSINLVVLAFSSVSIVQEDIRKDFRYKIKHGEESLASRSHKRHVIKAGSTVRFLVKSFDEEILHISGSLIPSHTGGVDWLDKNAEEGSQSESRSIKRERETSKVKAGLDSGACSEDTTMNSERSRSKKSKKGD
ncbi:probable DNA-directed RNA polymerase I subunit RPA43 isoform X1 [Papaver somniferum]|uniref:probable DNA-directed RNA polymerase I subunit RPA43 isoform X1 n=1 Tax=Papaver somniferum TaxID=3469 RepID=UPI000E700660|nr:probable DNA-directed RNA polymerase I subunit RPA43 isoform X1 [Papaver somniferum]